MKNAKNYLLVIALAVSASNTFARDSFSIGINVGDYDSYQSSAHSITQHQIVEYYGAAPIQHYAPPIRYYAPPIIHHEPIIYHEIVRQHHYAPHIIYQYGNNGHSQHQSNHYDRHRNNIQSHIDRGNRDQRWRVERDDYFDGNNGRNFRGYNNRGNHQGHSQQRHNPQGHYPQQHYRQHNGHR